MLNQNQKQELSAKLLSLVQNVKLNGNELNFGNGQVFKLPTQSNQSTEISSRKTTSR